MKVWRSPSRLPPLDASWAQTRGPRRKQAPRRMTRLRLDVIHPKSRLPDCWPESGTAFGWGIGPHSFDNRSMARVSLGRRRSRRSGHRRSPVLRGSVAFGADRLLGVQGQPEPPGELAGRSLAPEVGEVEG